MSFTLLVSLFAHRSRKKRERERERYRESGGRKGGGNVKRTTGSEREGGKLL